MSLQTYQVIHVISLMLLFFAFGGLTLGARTAGGRNFQHRRLYILLHGVGLAGLLVSGFGQLARLGLPSGMPGWVVTKLVIWLALGLSLSLVLRKPEFNKWTWILLIGMGAIAAYLGFVKP